MSKNTKSLVSIVLVGLILVSIFVGTTSAVHTYVGPLKVSPTSWNPSIKAGYSDYKVVKIFSSGWCEPSGVGGHLDPGACDFVKGTLHRGVIEGVTVEKISGPAWLKIEGETNLGDITYPESKKFTIRALPPEDVEGGKYPYKIWVSCTSGNPSYIYIQGEIDIIGKMGRTDKGTLKVKPTSWSPTIDAGDSKDKLVTVSTNVWCKIYGRTSSGPCLAGGTTYHGVIESVTVEKISGPAWLKIVGETNLGDITHPETKKFTIRASPPEDIKGTFPYKIRVSCTSGDPPYIDIQGEITVSPSAPTPTPSLTPSPKPTKPTQIPERPSWPTPAPAPAGFETVFAIAGLLVVTVYLIIRRKR